MPYLINDGWYHYELKEDGVYMGLYRVYVGDITICYCTMPDTVEWLCNVLNKLNALDKIQEIKNNNMVTGVKS